MDGFGSGGGVEVDNFRKALDQSEKEKADLRDKLSLVYMYQAHIVMRLQLEQSEKEKVDLRDKLDLVCNLYETHRVARLRAEEERTLLKAELEKLKARAKSKSKSSWRRRRMTLLIVLKRTFQHIYDVY